MKKEIIQKAFQLYFLSSGQILVFDKDGQQIGDLQAEFASGNPNVELLKKIAHKCEKFCIGKWGEWTQELNKQDFLTLTNLR